MTSLPRVLAAVPTVVIIMTVGQPGAYAGDPEAHAAAMEMANFVVANEPAFANGLGAPVKGGVPQMGTFIIPSRMVPPCSFALPRPPFDVGCAYMSQASEAVNEPDDWRCQDPGRQPPRMSLMNSLTAPGQSRLATTLTTLVAQLAMVCNWNHFAVNSILPSFANTDADAAFDLVWDWASELTDGIEQKGATSDAACDKVTFTTYLQRIYSSLHYTQDKTCEHHLSGNLVCTNTDLLPIFNSNPIYNIRQARSCMAWLGDTLQKATGAAPTYGCDQALMDPPTADGVELNPDLAKIAQLCGFVPDATGSRHLIPALFNYPKVSLACAGLERTFRHHCVLDTPKTIKCFGADSDHQNAVARGTWCEGEVYSGGGQDFLTLAEMATEPVLRKAAQRFADVCKQPDDPCVPLQCNNWCERTLGKANGGFCLNAAPDPTCTLHQCQCAPKGTCGALGEPCCVTSAACSGTLVCGGQTGTCVPQGQETCTGNLLVNGSFEVPPAANYQLFATGAAIAGWQVVGATGNVATIATTYTEGGFAFVAEDGQQSLDLTGLSNSATGVSQSVSTAPGTAYHLAFWVGNVVDPSDVFGSTSTVAVLINGVQVMTATNGSGGATLAWQAFSFDFTATSATTVIEFLNSDPATDNSNFLDNVSLK